ncbi:MAG: galactose oxidase, partial [Gemmatimonadetes bacterium]|nr:galactose oxidase [Gemmatimonadota bacterium]
MNRTNQILRVAITASMTLAFLAALLPAAPAHAANWQTHAPLPEPLGNNAVTGHTFGDTCYIYSFMGIDTTKIWSGVSQSAYRLNTVTNQWQTLPDVPGPLGRIAALAVGCGDKVYLFGGYTVAMSGTEVSLDAVDIFDPATMTWSAGAPIPVPVDDMVGGAWRDTLVYLVSGWSQTGNITNTQVYSPSNDSWDQATPFPTEGTFGGAGGVAGDFLVYADGVKGNFLMRNRVHRGAIDPGNPLVITWDGSGKHPGPALYRMASGTTDSVRMIFSGGTDNPYNFDGIGYNSVPSEPVATTWSYFPSTEVEIFHADKPTPTMDHRGFARCGDRL